MKNKLGYTLVEVIVIFAVAAIVLTPLTMLMASSLHNSSLITQIIDADQSSHQSLVVMNEAVRAEGFSGLTYVADYHSYGEGLIVGSRIFFLKNSNYVMQNYNLALEDISSEFIMNAYVDHVDLQLDANALEINIHVDKNEDGTVDDIYPFVYSRRD